MTDNQSYTDNLITCGACCFERLCQPQTRSAFKVNTHSVGSGGALQCRASGGMTQSWNTWWGSLLHRRTSTERCFVYFLTWQLPSNQTLRMIIHNWNCHMVHKFLWYACIPSRSSWLWWEIWLQCSSCISEIDPELDWTSSSWTSQLLISSWRAFVCHLPSPTPCSDTGYLGLRCAQWLFSHKSRVLRRVFLQTQPLELTGGWCR